ncbi:HAD family hydrolase [Inhella sp.]|uniref:HAD family hydrolase n=1 Tax=Inhella sp. TaxID=1921806 RepID=UPI0035AF84D8
MNLDAVRAWLIDLDGTLVDTLGDFVAAWAQASQNLGLPTRDAATLRPLIRRLIGRGGERLVRDLLAEAPPGAPDFDTAWAAYRAAYAAVNGQHAQAFPGAAEALQALGASGRRLACVTNKPQVQAEALLEQLGMRSYFADVVGQRPGLRAKPHPDAFEAAARQLGVPTRACGVIGDSRNDFEAARTAGCHPVLLLRHGYNHGDPVDAVPADAHLDDWPALLDGFSARSCRAAGL